MVQNDPEPIVVKETPAFTNNTTNSSDFEEDIFSKIEKLAALKDKNILSIEEFENKKGELLSRL